MIDKINTDRINYIETMTKELMKALKDTNKEIDKREGYLFQSNNRAKFERLRIELTKELLKVKKEWYR